MIRVADVITQINKMLISNFPNANVYFTDNREGYKNPSFFCTILSNRVDQINEQIKKHKVGIQLYYFPTDEHDYLEELTDVQEELDNLFSNGFQIEDIIIQQDEDGIVFDIADKVLNAIFYVNYTTQQDDSDKFSDMNELDFDFNEDL